MLQDRWRDVRHALRGLRSDPESSVPAILVLALGIGLTSAMFNVVNGVVLRGLPFEEAHRLVHLEFSHERFPEGGLEARIHDLRDWQAQQSSFEGLAGFYPGSFNLSDDKGFPERYSGAYVSWNTLSVLRVRPVLGRPFTADDEKRLAEISAEIEAARSQGEGA